MYLCHTIDREGSFGHGMLNISADGKTMSWEWHRNQDGVDIVTDSVTFVRDTTACPTRGGDSSRAAPGGH